MKNVKKILKKLTLAHLLRDLVLRRTTLTELRGMKRHFKDVGISLNLKKTAVYKGALSVFRAFSNTSFSLKKVADSMAGDNLVLIQRTDGVEFIVDVSCPTVATEVFATGNYQFHASILEKTKKYIVLDIGANRGYTALWFAAKDWCEKVYSFELIPETCLWVEKKITLDPYLADKIVFNHYGLGAQDNKIKATHFSGMDLWLFNGNIIS